jgi:predicted RNase H-like HicB family nuclease
MSKKSKNSKAIDRPFDPKVLRKAEAIAARYQIILLQEDDWFYGHGLELPHVYGDGQTAQAATDDTRAALTATVATILEDGERPPVPAADQTRGVQVNIRMNAEEKAIITQKAAQKGFRSISDYMRAVAVG